MSETLADVAYLASSAPKPEFDHAPDTATTAPANNAKAGKKDKADKGAKAHLHRSQVKIPKGSRDTEPLQMRIREKAFAIIKSIFLRHGAVGIDTPVFELKETLTGKYGEDSKLIYDLADQGGELLALRYDLTVPFARYIALHGVDNIKRYHIARVYRRDNPSITTGRYREFYQCDYDVAGVYDPMIPDSECIAIATEILDTLPVGSYEIKLNHRKLIDAIMAVCGVSADKYRTICSAIDKLDKEPWAKVKLEMIQKGLTDEVADKIGAYVSGQYRGDGRSVLSQLQSDTLLSVNELAQAAFKDLELLFAYTEALQCYHRIRFDLSLARGLDYYTGIIYECVLTSGETSLGSIAAGGRYDSLVGMFCPREVPCVGISIGIERIFALLETHETKQNTLRKTETQVFIAGASAGLTTAMMTSAATLWRAGIAAEYSYKPNQNMIKQLREANKNSIPLAVIHGEEEERDASVSVKVLVEHDQFKEKEQKQMRVKKSELVSKVTELLGVLSQASTASTDSAGVSS